MIFAYRQSAFKICSLVFLLSVTVRAKSIHSQIIDSDKHSQNIHQQHRQMKVRQSVTEANVPVTNQYTTLRTTLDDSVNHSVKPETLVNQQNEIEHGADLHPSGAKSENITRSQRTIGDLSDPEAMIENFRSKLKFARNHLEEMSHAPNKALDPKIFIYDPKIVVPVDRAPKFETEKLADKKLASEKIEVITSKDEPKERKIIKSPTNEKQSSKGSDHSNKEEIIGNIQRTTEMTEEDSAVKKHSVSSKSKSSNTQECTASQPAERTLETEEVKQEEVGNLIHMRGQINKLRSIMQVLKEHQIRQKLPADFMKNRKLTNEEQEELEALVKRMKEQGLISTASLDPSQAFGRSKSLSLDQINSENSEKLNQDVNRLREVITDLVQRTQVEKVNEENLGKLQLQLETQKVEIENLRQLVDKLLPPIKILTTSESKLIMHPTQMNAERIRLDEELKQLQDILSELMAKRNKDNLLRTTLTTGPALKARENGDENIKDTVNEVKMNDKIMKTDEELEALVKIFNSLAHPTEKREGKSMDTKIELLERELRELDNRNLRTRQEMLLEKLERDIRELKDMKIVPERADNIQAKIKKLEDDIKMHHEPKKISTIEDKIADLEKQIKLMAQPQSRDLNTNDNIDKELSKLQSEIDKLSQRHDSFQLPEHASSAPLQDRVQNILKEMLLNSEDSHPGKIISSPYPPASVVPTVPVLPVNPTQHTNHAYPHIFQLPFCLQKNHQYTVKPLISDEIKQYSDTQPEQYNVEQHSYPPKTTETMGQQPLIYKPHSTIDKYNKYDLNSVETFVHNKDLAQLTGTKPQTDQEYEEPSDTDSHSDRYRYRTKNAKLSNDNFPYFKSADFLNDNITNKPNMNIDEEISRLNEILRMLNEKISKMSGEKNTGHTKLRKKRSIEQLSQDNSIENMQKRLAVLKEQVEKYQIHTERKSAPEDDSTEIEENSPRRAYGSGYNYGESPDLPMLPGFKRKKIQKFDKLFIKIVKFILHKLEISAPYIVESLFEGEPLEFAYEGEDGDSGYVHGYRSAQTDNQLKYRSGEFSDVVQNVLGGFGGFGGGGIPGFNGLLGIIPTILFKLLSNFSSFLNILKRNNFFKNFLVPGLLILLVDGIMAILVWWFSPQDDTNNLISLVHTMLSRNKDTAMFKPNLNNPQLL